MKTGYYFHVPPEAREAGLIGPWLDFIGPFPTKQSEQQAKARLLEEANDILAETSPEERKARRDKFELELSRL